MLSVIGKVYGRILIMRIKEGTEGVICVVATVVVKYLILLVTNLANLIEFDFNCLIPFMDSQKYI